MTEWLVMCCCHQELGHAQLTKDWDRHPPLLLYVPEQSKRVRGCKQAGRRQAGGVLPACLPAKRRPARNPAPFPATLPHPSDPPTPHTCG